MPAAEDENSFRTTLQSCAFLLDGECTVATRDKLREHLEVCPTCLRHYGVEERIKTMIATKCGGEHAPEGLRARLQIEISRTTIIRRG